MRMHHKFLYLILILSIATNAIEPKKENIKDDGICAHVKGWLFWPSGVQIYCAKRAGYKQALLEAKMALYKCLAHNEAKAKDKEGMPIVCKEAMEKFLEVGGPKKLNKIKKSHNENFVSSK